MEPEVVVVLGDGVQSVSKLNHFRLINLEQILERYGVCRGVVVEVGQQEPERIADPTVRLAGACQDLVRNRHVLRIVSARHPEADNLSAQLVADINWRDGIAERL